MKEFEDIKRIVDEVAPDVEALVGRGNNSAATRIRKKMQELKAASQALRARVQEMRAEAKAAKAVAKKEE